MTPRALYVRRREFIQAAGTALAAVAATTAVGSLSSEVVAAQNPNAQKLTVAKKGDFSTDREVELV